jgi:hypothetical protein
MTWTDVHRKLRPFSREDREDILQEMQLQRLLYPAGRLDLYYYTALRNVLPRSQRQAGPWETVQAAVTHALYTPEHKEDSMRRICARLHRVGTSDVQETGLLFLLGYTQTAIARQRQVSQSHICRTIQKFATDVE